VIEMKKLIIIAALVLSASVSFAADKETLLLKQQLYQEKMARIQAQAQVLNSDYGDAQEQLKQVQAALKLMADKEKAASVAAKEGK
jgi:uncharacterized membrane protein (DUF106 family)